MDEVDDLLSFLPKFQCFLRSNSKNGQGIPNFNFITSAKPPFLTTLSAVTPLLCALRTADTMTRRGG